MIFEDGTHYEGEFRSAGVFNGKGKLTFSSGDCIDGTFNGAWTDGVKINTGTLHMNISNPVPEPNTKPKFVHTYFNIMNNSKKKNIILIHIWERFRHHNLIIIK